MPAGGDHPVAVITRDSRRFVYCGLGGPGRKHTLAWIMKKPRLLTIDHASLHPSAPAVFPRGTSATEPRHSKPTLPAGHWVGTVVNAVDESPSERPTNCRRVEDWRKPTIPLSSLGPLGALHRNHAPSLLIRERSHLRYMVRGDGREQLLRTANSMARRSSRLITA